MGATFNVDLAGTANNVLRSLTIHPSLVIPDKNILYRKSVAPIVNGPPR